MLETSSKYVWFSILRVFMLSTADFKHPWLTLQHIYIIHVLTANSITLQKKKWPSIYDDDDDNDNNRNNYLFSYMMTIIITKIEIFK